MALKFTNYTLKRCDQCFEKHFRKFSGKKLNRNGLSQLRSGNNDWTQFYFVNSDCSSIGLFMSSLINSLKIKVWYRLNMGTLRGEVCIRNIQDGTSSPYHKGRYTCDALEKLAKIYPMETLFYHLQIHIETLFYKFLPNQKSPQTYHNNGKMNHSNSKKGVISSNGQKFKINPNQKDVLVNQKVSSRPGCSGKTMYHQYHDRYNCQSNGSSNQLSRSTYSRSSEVRISWVLLIENDANDIVHTAVKSEPALKLTSIKVLLQKTRNASDAAPIDKPNYTILAYQASFPQFVVPNCSKNSNLKTENMVSMISSKDCNEEIRNATKRSDSDLTKDRPKTLTFSNHKNEFDDESNGMTDEMDKDDQSSKLLSPALSDLSISSVNVRQRTLSETVVHWVFDETSAVSSQSSSLNDMSQDYSSSTSESYQEKDGIKEGETPIESLTEKPIGNRFYGNQNNERPRRSRIAANIFGRARAT